MARHSGWWPPKHERYSWHLWNSLAPSENVGFSVVSLSYFLSTAESDHLWLEMKWQFWEKICDFYQVCAPRTSLHHMRNHWWMTSCTKAVNNIQKNWFRRWFPKIKWVIRQCLNKLWASGSGLRGLNQAPLTMQNTFIPVIEIANFFPVWRMTKTKFRSCVLFCRGCLFCL